MKKILICLLAAALLLCMGTASVLAQTLCPLPDTTMETLDNATVSVSLPMSDAYLDDTGVMRMRMSIYTYDLYDMVEVSTLAAGDTIVFCGEELAVTSVEMRDDGTLLINGGYFMDGLDLVTDDNGVYYVQEDNDSKSYYLIGEADYPVSDEFVFTDSSDLTLDEPNVFYAGDFLIGNEEIEDFFIPENTTVRIENGFIVEMNRVYMP